MSPGNHTIYFQVKDSSTLWSSKSDRWLYINDQPIATIVSVSPTTVYTNGTYVPSVDSNTIHLWRLDEGTGSSTSDTGSYGWTGSLSNGPSWVSGKSGYALEFDGDNDYVTSQSSTGTNNGEVTIEAWIKLSGDVDSESLIYAWGACPVQLRVTSSEKLKLNTYLNSGGSHYLTGSTTLVPGVWYHVAAIISESEDFMGLYINGTQDASFSLTSSDTKYHCGSNDRIGHSRR